ncbi:MAG: hypothetical protein QXJ68_07410 [Methanocellales archaeon]
MEACRNLILFHLILCGIKTAIGRQWRMIGGRFVYGISPDSQQISWIQHEVKVDSKKSCREGLG